MCKTVSCYIAMASIQAMFAFLLIPVYIICTATSYPVLWKWFFYNTRGICNASDKSCAISYAIYATFNCVVCLASIITSIMLAISIANANGKNRTKVLLTWLIVQLTFVMHHIILHIFSIMAMYIDATRREQEVGALINGIILIPFTISMLVAFSFFVPVLLYYRRLKREMEIEKDNERTEEQWRKMEETSIPLVPM